ncbi:adenosylcobinamide-phosphate synthase CbiB [Candidatus Formimonas warabiya]|uniref:Cobalamin biosynthesis protein CobD n=1 Tax=Formimonas warabiya TaxID=1761012 RepID=A0A3G1L011_FORW1|nr:adenosylcobinamide-phosphate synthase CbiB [Candidatus Formimonas warabiya]ATW28122.1 adenosylcobinamide-phosphate synthase [Candidatus Formimonas warabiya]
MVSIWAAYVLDLILGDPYRFPHPVVYIGKYVSFVEGQVRRIASSPLALKAGGIFLTISTVLITYGLTWGVLSGVKALNIWLFYFLNIVLMWTCLAAKSLRVESMKVFGALDAENLAQARTAVSYIVGRDTSVLDEEEVTKATVETVVENTADGIVAPLFYMFIGGAPLALAYKAINTMDSMVGYKNEKYLDFGWAAARLDDLANFIPARITGFFLTLAAFFLKLNYLGSIRVLIRDRRNHLSPNCGYPEAAAAGALNIQLGGTHTYFNQVVHKPTIGDDLRPVQQDDILWAIRMMVLSSVLVMIFFSFIYWFIIGQIEF